MALPDEFDPFVEGAPCAVIARLAAEWMLDDASLQRLFQEHAQTQYEREITLTNLVNVMLEVATGARRSTRASFQETLPLWSEGVTRPCRSAASSADGRRR